MEASGPGGDTPLIEHYVRIPVEVLEPDPAAPRVAGRLIDLIVAARPGTLVEHIGSTAVPDLPGKGTIDLLVPAEAAEVPAVAACLLRLGFQRQSIPQAFPPTRPMLQGVVRHGARRYRVHVHVVPAGDGEVTALRGFRDALRADAALRRDYAALKLRLLADGLVDAAAFSSAKHDYIAAALRRLGLPVPPRRP